MTETKFINEVVAGETYNAKWTKAAYTFDRAPKLLFVWSRRFQALISQAGTFLLTGKFHTQECGIYKSEGGVKIPGVGELVLGDSSCYWDRGRDEEKTRILMSKLISHVVCGWNPNDPINSMDQLAVDFINTSRATDYTDLHKTSLKGLQAAVNKSYCGGIFGGDSLSNFFGWNPFSKAPIDRDYQRFCLTKFWGKTEAEVDQKYADQDLGESILKRLDAASRERNPNQYLIPLCCSPNRNGDKLGFWVNTGRQTQIDGWHTQQELEAWLDSGKPLVDKANY